jgi:pimeloyl-ACP methyl ester carboxylesterase
MTPELNDEISNVWSELQTELTALSTSGEQRVIDDATHYIQYDNPDAVIQAIRDVVTASE